MNNYYTSEAFLGDLLKDTRPEAIEMKGILLRMIKSEVAWVKTHDHQKSCSRCKKLA